MALNVDPMTLGLSNLQQTAVQARCAALNIQSARQYPFLLKAAIHTAPHCLPYLRQPRNRLAKSP
jgi:hypothetical protein